MTHVERSLIDVTSMILSTEGKPVPAIKTWTQMQVHTFWTDAQNHVVYCMKTATRAVIMFLQAIICATDLHNRCDKHVSRHLNNGSRSLDKAATFCSALFHFIGLCFFIPLLTCCCLHTEAC